MAAGFFFKLMIKFITKLLDYKRNATLTEYRRAIDEQKTNKLETLIPKNQGYKSEGKQNFLLARP